MLNKKYKKILLCEESVVYKCDVYISIYKVKTVTVTL